MDPFDVLLSIMLGNDLQQPEYDEDIHLATYYSPLFAQQLRTDEFKNLFKECFGQQSYICHGLPRPLMCQDCLQKCIHHTQNLVNKNNVYKDVILPRLIEVQETMLMINEHNRVSTEQISMDTVYELLGINMDHYDPPSQTVLDQCVVTSYQKNEDNKMCVICQCDYEEGEQIKTLTCQHQFHDECIMQWLKNHSTCPICHASLK